MKYKFDSSFAKQTIVSVYKKGLFHLLGANSLILAFGFLSQLFVAWILTPVDIGVIKLLQTYSSIFITIGGFGYNISVLKLCSENRSDGEKKYLYQKGLAYSIVGSAISYSLIAVLVLTNLLSEDKTVNNYMLLFGVGVVPQVTSSVYFSYLQALQKMTEFSKIQIYTKLISIIMLICLTYFFLLNGYIISLILGYLFTNLLLIYKIRYINKSVISHNISAPFKLHNQYSFSSLFANLLNIFILSIDILIINFLTEDKVEIGYYSFGLTLVSFLMIFSTTVMQILNPHFSKASGNFEEWNNNVIKYSRLILKAAVLIFIISLFVVPVFLNYAFNGKYKDSIIYFIILSVAWVFKNFILVKASALFGLGKIKINILVGVISLPVYVILITLGTLYFNLLGAAIAVVLSSVFSYFSNTVIFNKVIKNEKKNRMVII